MDLFLEKQRIPCGMSNRSARFISIDENTGKLAVVRRTRLAGDHDYVELYNVLTGWLAIPELVICPENGSIEHILFVDNGELMTSHANGSVCFIDPHNSLRVKRVQVSASTIWAACKHPTGTSGESIYVLVSHSSVLYFFDAISKTIKSSISLGVDNRLFDVASNGKTIAIGSIDGIILVCDGKVQKTLKLDRQNRRDPTIAWSVIFVKHGVLASGDSRGIVTFWNPSDGAMLHSVLCLQSHILTMCLADGELNVSGVDPRIVVLKEISNGTYEIVNRRSGPTRDVRSMVTYDNTVFAAGEDFDIYVCKSGTRRLIFQQQKHVLISQAVVASAGENFIDIWWKEQGEDAPIKGSNNLRQHHEMRYIAKIFSSKKRVITCWTLSNCGEYLVIGTCNETTVYSLTPKEPKLSKKVVKIITHDIVATCLCITKKKHVLAATADFKIVMFDLESTGMKVKSVICQNDCGAVVKMTTTPGGDYLSLLTTRSQVFCINIETACSRLAKVELPIDLASTTNSVIVLTSQPAFSENSDSKKIFHEVGVSNGIVKHSASSHQLRMVPTSPKSMFPGQPISLCSFGDSKAIAASYDGHWSIIDLISNSVVSAMDGPLKARKNDLGDQNHVIVGVRSEEESNKKAQKKISGSIETPSSRVLLLNIIGDELPKFCGFKVKRFGMQ